MCLYTVAAASNCLASAGVSPYYELTIPLQSEDIVIAESVYKVIELVGTSTESWERVAAAAVSRAGESLRDLRVAEVTEMDMQIEDGKVSAFRAKVKISFKFEDGD